VILSKFLRFFSPHECVFSPHVRKNAFLRENFWFFGQKCLSLPYNYIEGHAKPQNKMRRNKTPPNQAIAHLQCLAADSQPTPKDRQTTSQICNNPEHILHHPLRMCTTPPRSVQIHCRTATTFSTSAQPARRFATIRTAFANDLADSPQPPPHLLGDLATLQEAFLHLTKLFAVLQAPLFIINY